MGYHWYRVFVEKQGILSTESDVPWTTLFALLMWIIVAIFGRGSGAPPGSDPALAWPFAVFALLFYFYKVVENFVVTFYGFDKWWTVRYVSHKSRQRSTQRSISVWDAFDLAIAVGIAWGLMVFALYESDPAAFTGVNEPSSAVLRLVDLTSMAYLTLTGTGFGQEIPANAGSKALMATISRLGTLFELVIVGSLIAVVMQTTQKQLASKSNSQGDHAHMIDRILSRGGVDSARTPTSARRHRNHRHRKYRNSRKPALDSQPPPLASFSISDSKLTTQRPNVAV